MNPIDLFKGRSCTSSRRHPPRTFKQFPSRRSLDRTRIEYMFRNVIVKFTNIYWWDSHCPANHSVNNFKSLLLSDCSLWGSLVRENSNSIQEAVFSLYIEDWCDYSVKSDNKWGLSFYCSIGARHQIKLCNTCLPTKHSVTQKRMAFVLKKV